MVAGVFGFVLIADGFNALKAIKLFLKGSLEKMQWRRCQMDEEKHCFVEDDIIARNSIQLNSEVKVMENEDLSAKERLELLDQERRKLKSQLQRERKEKLVKESKLRIERNARIKANSVKLKEIQKAIYKYNKLGKVAKMDYDVFEDIQNILSGGQFIEDGEQ